VRWQPGTVELAVRTHVRELARVVPQPGKPDPLLLAVLAGELVSDALRATPPVAPPEPPPPPAAPTRAPSIPASAPTLVRVGLAVDGALSQAGQPFLGPSLFARVSSGRWGAHFAAGASLALPLGTPADFSAQAVSFTARVSWGVFTNSVVRCALELGARLGAVRGVSSLVTAWSWAGAAQGGATLEAGGAEWRGFVSAMAGFSLVGVHWLREGTEFSGWHGLEGVVTVGLLRAW
jgi:hypothetical protein